MKALGWIAFGIVAVGILALVGYGAYVYLLPRWIPIVFYLYAAMALVVLALGIRSNLTQSSNPTTIDANLRMVTEASRTMSWKTRLNYLRERIVSGVSLIGNTPIWPVPMAMGMINALRQPGRTMPSRELFARLSTSLIQNYMSAYSLAVVVGVVLLEMHTGRTSPYETIILYALLISTSIRHFAYSIATVSLPASLRRAVSMPYLAFIVIILTDFSILVLVLTVVGTPNVPGRLSFNTLHETSNALLAAQEPLKLVRGVALTFHQLLTGFVGLFFYLALMKTLWDFREFKRQDEDFVSMAGIANEMGNFSAALQHLQKVRSWNGEGRMVKLVALLGVNRVDLAEREAELFLEDRQLRKTPNTVFEAIWGVCSLTPLSDEVKLEIIERAIKFKVNDFYLILAALGMTENKELNARFHDLLSSVAADYPLTLACLCLNAGNLEECNNLLSTVPLSSPNVEIPQRVLSMKAMLMNPETGTEEDTKNFREWAKQNLPRIREMAVGITDPNELFFAILYVISILPFAGLLASERVQELKFLISSLKSNAKLQPEQMRMLEIVEEDAAKS